MFNPVQFYQSGINNKVLNMPLSTNLLDYSGLENHATMVGIETHTSGGLQTSSGNWASIPNKTSLDIGAGSIEFGCTVKFNSITGVKGIIGKSEASGSLSRYAILLESNNINSLTQTFGSVVINSTPASTYNDGNFHRIKCVFNRLDSKQYLYINDVLINALSFTPIVGIFSINKPFYIGAYGAAGGTGILANSEFNGIIKDVYVKKF